MRDELKKVIDTVETMGKDANTKWAGFDSDFKELEAQQSSDKAALASGAAGLEKHVQEYDSWVRDTEKQITDAITAQGSQNDALNAKIAKGVSDVRAEAESKALAAQANIASVASAASAAEGKVADALAHTDEAVSSFKSQQAKEADQVRRPRRLARGLLGFSAGGSFH